MNQNNMTIGGGSTAGGSLGSVANCVYPYYPTTTTHFIYSTPPKHYTFQIRTIGNGWVVEHQGEEFGFNSIQDLSLWLIKQTAKEGKKK